MGLVSYAECLASSRAEHGDAVHELGQDCYYVEKRVNGALRGVDFFHRCPDGEACGGYVNILGEREPRWTVEQENPLTLAPSVWCKGYGHDFHGWIRNGRWEGV